ncbi:uncharacterized protein LOC142981401 isoform X2 [Anticarsia gemmatalis]
MMEVDPEYDRKFEEMKKYIPFLENMISRLETSSTASSNPRQAQLDKIRSLRDLLSNKNKRMKMENLMKCEQVLVNLYAKVEQRDFTLSGFKKSKDSGFMFDAPTSTEKSELEAVRSKLKNVAQRQDNATLPEIFQLTEGKDVNSGSKEPALFQRRPSKSTRDNEDTKISPQSSRRNYTRVLVSPDSSPRKWSPTKNTGEKPLFSRRTPRKSPRRYSPPYHKKERKKRKDSDSHTHKDVNITLSVPEARMDSLYTDDIVDRIMNCKDSDVDIDTLRELQKQIRSELRKTGSKEDISDFILESYETKDKSRSQKKEEVEEGELSDSESEMIGHVYSKIEPGEHEKQSEKERKETLRRKIQICLVINSDEKEAGQIVLKQDNTSDFNELEMYDKETSQKNSTAIKLEHNTTESKTFESKRETNNSGDGDSKKNILKQEDSYDTSTVELKPLPQEMNKCPENIADATCKAIATKQSLPIPDKIVSTSTTDTTSLKEPIQNKANFYKPLLEPTSSEKLESDNISKCAKALTLTLQTSLNKTEPVDELSEIEKTLKQMERSPEIPLLNEPTLEMTQPKKDVSAEVEILQALKSEILAVTQDPVPDTGTPALHQPKVIKVANAKDISSVRRITIETYKEKATTTKVPLDPQVSSKGLDDHFKKTSLKLTDKECKRFSSILDDVPKTSYDEEDESFDYDDDIGTNDLYSDLVPKSPDHDESSNIKSAPPVIIPVDPVKTVPVNYKADVDMRTTIPLLSPSSAYLPTKSNNVSAPSNNDFSVDIINPSNKIEPNRPFIDPRMKRDSNLNVSNQNSNPYYERNPRNNLFIGKSAPSAPNSKTTPNARTYDMTHKSFEIEPPIHSNVYVPSLDLREKEKSVSKESRWETKDPVGDRRSRIDDLKEACWNPTKKDMPQSPRYNDSFSSDSFNMGPRHDRYRSDSPRTSVHSFGMAEASVTSSQPFPRLEAPMTPSHPFGRSDCPPTPTHPFGRLECPPTPNPSFGRLECPPTPNPSFGRLEGPTTPGYPYARMDCPPTPIHPFGRLECPSTPTHPFGRTDISSLIYNAIDCPPKLNNPFGGTEQKNSNQLFSTNESPIPNLPFFQSNNTSKNQRPFALLNTPIPPKSSFVGSDPMKNQYSRSDYNAKNYNKDPRLNRKPESESKTQYNERDRSYYEEKDRYRGGSYSSHKSYGVSSSYRDQNVNKNSKYRYYSPDLEARNKDQRIRERSVGRSISKDRNDTVPPKEHRFVSDVRSYQEVGRRRESPRERSIGRNIQSEDIRSSPRSQSIGRQNSRESVSLKKLIDSAKEMEVIANSFDSRRQRAASVGRSLTRESSIGRTSSKNSQPKSTGREDKREAFQRAASVGRDLSERRIDKRSFQEIKADFISFKCTVFGNTKSSDPRKEISNERDNRSRKDVYEKQKYENTARERSKQEPSKPFYSPRKNIRDPRMRRQLENKGDRHSSDSHSRKSGIVYSNDNIVTGSILSSGYGVKNYKIPKIKRAPEEKEVVVEKPETISNKDEKAKKTSTTQKDLSKEKVNDNDAVKQKKEISKDLAKEKSSEPVTSKQNKNASDEVKSAEVTERRTTRSSKKGFSVSKTATQESTKTKKYKKLIYSSDSDTETDNISQNLDDDNSNSKAETSEHVEESAKNKDDLDSVTMDSSFGIDELDMFTDNIASDPVIDNINALIADLDNDIGTSKTDSAHNFTKEITLENMMESISSPQKEAQIAVDQSSQDKNENASVLKNVKDKPVSNTDPLKSSALKSLEPDQISSKDEKADTDNKDQSGSKDLVGNLPTQSDVILKKSEALSSDAKSSASLNNEDIDSTTEVEKDVQSNEDKQKLDDLHGDSCSTPDSTINNDDALQKSINEDSQPGNANEVTSTESIDPKPSSSTKETAPALEAISSLLSILQDKSKLKEYLNMCDPSSENEKIIKRLEKWSEIIKDEESRDVSKNEQTEEGESIPAVPTESEEKVDEHDEGTEVEAVRGEELSKDGSVLNESNSKLGDDDSKTSEMEISQNVQESSPEIQPKKKPVKKTKAMKKTRGRAKKITSVAEKRVTRATVAETKPKVKKLPRELMQLQEDIKEMFIRDDVLNANGIRMCRLAKLVDEKVSAKEDPVLPEAGPVVVLQKVKDIADKPVEKEKGKKKKVGPKTRMNSSNENLAETTKAEKAQPPVKNKPGPKSKTKNKKQSDPYAFEFDYVDDTNTEKASDVGSSINNSSDSENESIASSQSHGSTELLSDVKKKIKRKRRGWKLGVIKTKSKRKKVEQKQPELTPDPWDGLLPNKSSVPDNSCFIDRNYCFKKNQQTYSCRLCVFTGSDIVLHYRNQHPHVEIPLSRIAPEVAKEAIGQCEEINFKAISKIPSDKYVCTFCYKEFTNSKSVLETFFWHIVSMHTGEYKQNCSKCVNVNECPFNLDIPSPPKNVKGQLIGFICQKCNFTQISLENLKTHVINRHNDVQTAVYTINLSVMTKKALNNLLRRSETEKEQRTAAITSGEVEIDNNSQNPDTAMISNKKDGLRSRTADEDKRNVKLRPRFETDDVDSESDIVSETGEATVKIEGIDPDNADGISFTDEYPTTDHSEIDKQEEPVQEQSCPDPEPSSDIVNYPHFKINITETGTKEYFCCINGNHHFKTTLLISMKKHVQSKHAENWDGYCFVCKVIVTPQGAHRFRDCLQHYLDKHMDNFPIYEKEAEPEADPSSATSQTEPADSKPFINVRPLSDLITKTNDVSEDSGSFPIIQSVMSLGSPAVESPRPSSIYPIDGQASQMEEKVVQYEEFQTQVSLNKYNLVNQTMLIPENLIKIFKCAGRYCSYTTDSVEEALEHATAHQRVGGADTLNCCYCDFDSAGNAIDLVMHVFKSHGSCIYCCAKCLYRASSSQCVGSHISRVHGGVPEAGSVLRTTKLSTIPPTKSTILTREQAVSFYICGHSDAEGPCKFRTYIPDKFTEHLNQRHEPPHPCHLCSEECISAGDLLQHAKSHGLKLYQCTWCVHGADNESELLAHVSSVHPDKHPQAYIRIITNKEGTTEKRILPLAFLNKYQVPHKDLVPTPTKEHPVREAERCVELERLIGHIHKTVAEATTAPAEDTETPIETAITPLHIEAPVEMQPAVQITQAPIITNEASNDTLPEIPPEILTEILSDTYIDSPTLPAVTVETKPLINIEPSNQEIEASSQIPLSGIRIPPDTQITLVKKEPLDKKEISSKEVSNEVSIKEISSEVVVLDSDDEDMSTQFEDSQVIDLSDDEPTTTSSTTTTMISTTTIAMSSTTTSTITSSTFSTTSILTTCTITSTNSIPITSTDSTTSIVTSILNSIPTSTLTSTTSSIKSSTAANPADKRSKISNSTLYKCPQCMQVCKSMTGLKRHTVICLSKQQDVPCPHCPLRSPNVQELMWHYLADHSDKGTYECKLCSKIFCSDYLARRHIKQAHKEIAVVTSEKIGTRYILSGIKKPEAEKEKVAPKRKLSGPKADALPSKRRFEPQEIDQLPINPILDHLVYCNRCEFSTKVRLNMVRHLQLHAEQQPVPQTAPVNPVPHLESNEKHFDKMVNLASSSIVSRTPEKTRAEPTVSLLLPPEAAARYPKYVPERQRHTCGAKGCSYISVDEAMLRRHWDTLHSGTRDFLCVHCPPHQLLDTSKPLTANRILSHLKMHDSSLYACSMCSFYHHRREALEKHLSDIHKTGQLLVVREEYTPVPAAAAQTVAAPTMDLKPWQCGLCKFKSMLRPEVVDHCSRMHQSKMQFKCAYCPFRTSAIENISKHQANSHAGKPEEVFYYYYREGSIPDEADGTPKWMKQRLKAGPSEPEVKVEAPVSPRAPEPGAPLTIDLNLVKKEVDEQISTEVVAKSVEELCRQFGQICEPNGIKYKCPLCTAIMEDTREAMQSHLYEELNYRKWGCGLCSYKAFHKEGLTEHMTSEHRRQYDHIELPADVNIEKWVLAVLNHQTNTISKFKDNLAKQKIIVENKPGPSNIVVAPQESTSQYTETDLQAAFGQFGAPTNTMLSCPKCVFTANEEAAMLNHLEMELNKIRWCCSSCARHFQTYHEAQFHCKGHDGAARPVEAIRDPKMRAEWVTTCIQTQQKELQNVSSLPSRDPPTVDMDNDNSLLVVRYEERVPTPEQVNTRRKRSAPDDDEESDLVIDEEPRTPTLQEILQKTVIKHCPYCGYKSSHYGNLKIHMLTHFNMKAYACNYCTYGHSYKRCVRKHQLESHPDKPSSITVSQLPRDSKKATDTPPGMVRCLTCEKKVPGVDLFKHWHDKIAVPTYTDSDTVYKCCICFVLFIHPKAVEMHHRLKHADLPLNYETHKLGVDWRETYNCVYCDMKFTYIKDYTHHISSHKSESPTPKRRCARKSTTKLPNSVAKKSTTKLPYSVPNIGEQGYSYYGRKALPITEYTDVTTMMSFCNRMMPFSMKQLSEHLNMEPRVTVTDFKRANQ